MALHVERVLALQQCSPASALSGCSFGVRAQGIASTSMPVLQLASSSSSSRVRTQFGFGSSCLDRDRVSFRCGSVSKSQTGRDAGEVQGAEFDRLGEEDLDALFDEYGETVRNDEESSSVTSEVDEDSDCLAFAVALAEAANDVKGSDIQVLCVKPLIYWARFFVVVTAFSKPQIDAVGKRMRDVADAKFNRSPKGDSKPNAWTLFDYGDVVVHIFLPKEREFYNLEEFYGNATLVKLPFENRSTQ